MERCRSPKSAHKLTMSLAAAALLFIVFLAAAAAARDTITPSTPLSGDETLVSAGGTFALGFFSPPNSGNTYLGIWFTTIPQTVVWVANRAAPISGAATTATVALTAAAVLSISNTTWSAASSIPLTNPVAQLLDTGNLVIAGGATVGWQSFDHPTDTLLPGMTIGPGRNLTAWTSPSDPAPSAITAAMSAAGYPELILYSGGAPLWRSGPWNGAELGGFPPEPSTFPDLAFTFSDAGEYGYNVSSSGVLSRLVLNGTGAGATGPVLQLLRWVSPGGWISNFYSPMDPCDAFAACGPFGLCNGSILPICSCLHGFRPKNPTAWALRQGKDGCVRNTTLGCSAAGGGADGFQLVANVKLPETARSVVDVSMGMEGCRAACLKDCNCTAYAGAGGAGCIMWSGDLTDVRVYSDVGQQLFVRLAAADVIATPPPAPEAPADDSSSDGGMPVALIASLSVVGAILVAGTAFFIFWKRRRRQKASSRNITGATFSNIEVAGRSGEDDIELPNFDLETIAAATDGFSAGNKLGEGGFGPVYKGKLPGGQEVAVKCLAKTSMQGLDEFKNEVMLIARLQHRNLVRLLGCSSHGDERMLVYEYMENKSLDAYLFDRSRSVLLDFRTRYRIIIGIARGLVYLHQDSRFRIIHRDLKASNILLDREMTPKISDFGMARIFGGDETEINTRRVVGTYGYMSPEYAMDGVFSMKSDVFSFGVLVLEIISGQRNRGGGDSDHQSLLAHAWNLWKERRIVELVDDALAMRFPEEEALKCIRIGLLCVQEHPDDRPLMPAVILMLVGGGDSELLPVPKKPGFYTRRAPAAGQESSTSSNRSIVNSLTITVLEGR